MRRALLGGVILALASDASQAQKHAVTQQEIDAAIDRGVAHQLDQYQDGEGRDHGTIPGATLALAERPGLRALTVYALLKSGVAPEHPVVERLVRRLSLERVSGTYDVACLLLALVALDPFGQRAWIEELARSLVQSREKAGDYGYPGGGDLSNTQFAAFALRAAVAAGVAVPAEVWSGLSDAVLRYQSKDGGFAYMTSARTTSSTMTAAGVGVLAICEIELARCGKLDDDTAAKMRRAREGGLDWLARRRDFGKALEGESWQHYFLYGIERAGGLCGLERIGDHEWYREGATFLVANQDDHGDWPGTFERAPALFALLFLARATASGPATIAARSPRTGPLPRPFPHQTGSDTVGGMRLEVEGTRALRLWVWRIACPANAAWEWPNERGRGPHVARVEFLADGAPIEVVLGDAKRPVESRRFEGEHIGLAPGRHVVTARVHVLPLPGEDKEGVIETNGVDVEIAEDSRSRAAPEPAFDPARDLALTAGSRAKATSTRSVDGFPFDARLATDGNPRTPWLAEENDTKPVLEISFGPAVQAGVVRITPARLAPRSPDFLALPRQVAIAVNGSAPRVIEIGTDRTWFDLPLGEPTRVRTLEIRLTRGDDAPKTSVGIGEVVLLDAPK